ncbi:MAG: archaeosortase A [Candidatus Thermoplasmatota archaeon]|nr:archaeosortase A [Candidatus Thermoplasmatota archaeon]
MASSKSEKNSEKQIACLFILLPIIYTIIGIIFFPYPLDPFIQQFLPIPLFLGLGLLAFGSFTTIKFSWFARVSGWVVFSMYWATQPNTLYYAENHDLVNAILCIAGIFVLFYLAYHDWYAERKKLSQSSLRWIAAASAIAGLIYFIIELTPLETWLILVVAEHSGWLLSLFVSGVVVEGRIILFDDAVIRIIFACTAVQSMVIFIGILLPLQTIDIKRKTLAIVFTITTVYMLNLVRNASIVFLVGIYGSDFFHIAHNYIGKGGSLIALVAILFILGKFMPEIFDEIFSLIDLSKRKGPIETWIKKIIKRNT